MPHSAASLFPPLTAWLSRSCFVQPWSAPKSGCDLRNHWCVCAFVHALVHVRMRVLVCWVCPADSFDLMVVCSESACSCLQKLSWEPQSHTLKHRPYCNCAFPKPHCSPRLINKHGNSMPPPFNSFSLLLTYACMHPHTHTHTYTHTHIYACTYTCTYTYTCNYTYT